jgi:hypothetical protein
MDYSRVELAADARHRVCGCGSSPQIPCNEADIVARSVATRQSQPFFMSMRSPRFARDDNLIIAQVVKSARPKGKLCRHIINRNAFETD